MIIDNTIKKAILNDSRISEIHKGPILAWKEGEVTSTMMATGITINKTLNKSMIKFELAGYSITPPVTAIDISEAKDGSVVTWYDATTKIQYYKPVGVDKAVLNSDSILMFNGCTSLTTIPLLDTSKVTNMREMFSGCTKLTSIPLLNTSNVSDMQNTFNGCTRLTTIPLLDTSKVNNMGGMFNGCKALNSIPILDTHNVTKMSNMFYNCIGLIDFDLSNFDTSNVISMSNMFNGCTDLNNLNLSSFNTFNVTNMNLMFKGCKKLVNIIYGNNFINDNCTTFSEMFSNCPANKPEWTNGTWDDTGTFTKTV